jgi:predicted nuclease of predicted toxin-antitoxin system
MKFKTDQNLPSEAADLLRSAGHDAVTVGEQQLSGAVDSTVASICQRERRALVTLDLDFADIRAYPPDRHPGFIVLRLARQDKASVLRAVGRTIPLLAGNQITGRLWIVEEHRVRIHGE